jgi:NTE family protein
MRALVLSGGGSKGSYQVGALKHLLGNLKLQYDILCGVSVGAINAAYLSMFAHGKEQQSIDALYNMWVEINSSSIYKRHFPFGRWHALWKNSFYDSSPLHKLIKNNINLKLIRESGKIVTAGTVSLSSGKYTIFDQTSDCFVDAVIASASFPGMLAPVKFLDQLWTDGGVKELSPIKKAIELGADIIDIIVTSPEQRVKKFIDNPTTVDILKTIIDLSTDKILANDIDKIQVHNKLAKANVGKYKNILINIIRPDNNLTEDLLDFDPNKIKEMLEKGYYDAKNKFIL